MFALGLIAGIFGVISAVLAMFIGGVGEALNANGASTVSGLGMAALLFSILGIIAAAISKSKTKLAGWLMLVAGVGGFISVSLFYILSGILFVVGGLMGIFSKKKSNQNQGTTA
ncbi:DUF4064 domain-containing protein [Brevibacillus sp. GCM10020057]|uniref:DUF4064 domain-containing protein n=1 Tax=Brevibacillus sp. GCM10020057 TaxID=3317327 RepID=UPI0036414957